MGLLYISQRVETGQATLAAVCVYYVKLTNYGTVLYKWAMVHNTALCGKDASRTYKNTTSALFAVWAWRWSYMGIHHHTTTPPLLSKYTS